MVDASNSAAVVRSLIVPGKASWRSCGGGRAASGRAVNGWYSVESSFFSRLGHSTRCIVLLSGRQMNVCELDRCRMPRRVVKWRRALIVAQRLRQIQHQESRSLDHPHLVTSTPCLEKPSPQSVCSPAGGARRMQLSLLSAQSLSVGQYLFHEIL